MGVNNKQRRAAKKKRAAHRSGGPQASPQGRQDRPELSAADLRALLFHVLDQIHADSAAAAACADRLLHASAPLTPEIVRSGLRALLADLVRSVVSGGWSPNDLVEITSRRAGAEHVPVVVALLHAEASRHAPGRVPAAWSQDLARCGRSATVDLQMPAGLQQVLELAAVLARLPRMAPVLPAPGSVGPRAAAPSGVDGKLLARVQALLAKAEATEFAAEAEALSAKAQELVSRYALDRLLARADAEGADVAPQVRRMWLVSPYVLPKAMLVHEVASANRCRSVVSDALGCCTLVGDPGDLEVVELLVPSLLVQAHAAMRSFGRQTDRAGTSRTRSFRQSFLLAYAQRIGERLRTTDDEVTSSSPRGGELVPVLKRQREAIDAACDELFPDAVAKGATVGNAHGWAAGRAAADQARLGAYGQVEAQAS